MLMKTVFLAIALAFIGLPSIAQNAAIPNAIDPDDTLLNAFFGIEIEDFRIVFSDLSARKREDIIFDVCHILMPLQIVDAAFRVFQYDGKPLLLASVDAIAIF